MIVRSRTPLRLGLAGGGTDVSPYSDIYGGYVLNVTINMYAYCTIEPTDDGKITFHAVDRNEIYSVDSKPHLEVDDTLILHKGVYNRIVKDYNGGRPLSFKMTTYSDAPAGSGLGTSSTMVVTILKAYAEWMNLPLGEYDLAYLAYEIERKDLNLSGGKQDQYAATFGGLNFMEFYKDDKVIVNPLRVKEWIKNELESSLVLFYTGTSRESAKIIDEQIENAQKKQEKSIEAMHALKKGASIMKEALLKGDFDTFTECVLEGWKAKKQMAKVITNSVIDDAYEYAITHGAKAAKISGAGGGGFMMIIVDPVNKFSLMQALKELDGKVMDVKIVQEGTQAWAIY